MRMRLVSARRGTGKYTYLCSPCPITCHPLTIDSILAIRAVVDLPRGKIPFSLEDWVVEKGLYAFQRISVEQDDWFHSVISVDGDILHLPFWGFQDMVHAGSKSFRSSKGER